ncbi:MAG: Spx/MgsR family RNA polymerase-binding regulatory protein [Acidobacteria bacterium]|jgi:arsenate reductase|nr:Spx/MgsR family RNA polymerase-binding regulatory protein [Acidobacteriota bacterium]
MKDTIFYWLPNCTTCQKAKRRLERHKVLVTQFRDLKEEPLIREEVENLAKMLGGAGELFSRRAVKYRELKLNERKLSEEEMIDLMAAEYTFLKRPILVINGKATAGYFEKFFDMFLNENYYNK